MYPVFNRGSDVTVTFRSQQENVTLQDGSIHPNELSKSCGQIDPPSLYFRSAFTRSGWHKAFKTTWRGVVVESTGSPEKGGETELDPRCVPRRGIKGLRCDIYTSKSFYLSARSSVFPDARVERPTDKGKRSALPGKFARFIKRGISHTHTHTHRSARQVTNGR